MMLSAIASPVFASETPSPAKDLFDRMVVANRERDYQGIFTYEHAGVLRSLRILHLVRDGYQYQRLLYLNGPRKEILEQGTPVGCKNPGERLVLGQLAAGAGLDGLEDHYQFALMPEKDRVADREVQVLQVVPKDEMRYGYILSIDSESGLLLQSLLIGTNRRAMERFHFVDLSLEPDPEQVAALLDSDASQGLCPQPVQAELASWQAGWLPPGFELVAGSPGETGGATLSFTDGLSFVSVFVDPEGATNFPDIQAQRGATVAQVSTVSKDGQAFTVCVVGEVPGEVASRIARFIAPKADTVE